ncbi:MAG: Raf kinase inhibitor-like YbhB/YbcL family protein [Granulosicoccus sp.]|jgi:Raf kinase inhibitor-like YbhB/YbcL family protein
MSIMLNTLVIVPVLLLLVSVPAFSNSFTLSSSDITAGEFMSSQFEFVGFGCDGDDQSPNLQWTDAPTGTKSFAITAYDPDAPTGSGWWHWQVINIPATVTELSTNAGSVSIDLAPVGSQQIVNDYGSAGFGGACPPVGHGVHRYQFTIHALSVEQLELPENASGALAGYMINANSIESSTIEALYKRD